MLYYAPSPAFIYTPTSLVTGSAPVPPGPPPTPPAPPPPTPPDIPLATYNGAVVVSTVGKPSVAFTLLSNSSQIAALDTVNANLVAGMKLLTRAYDGGNPGVRKRFLRVNVWGTGTILTATMTVRVDQSTRTDTYTYGVQSVDASEGILWRQTLIPLTGYQADVLIEAQGTDLQLLRAGFELVVIQ